MTAIGAAIGRRAIIAGVAAALIGGGARAGARVGQPAPKFTVVTIDHDRYSLADLAGKVVVLNYWASWCAPCKGEVVVLDNYMRRHAGTDLKIFAIDADQSTPEPILRKLAKILAYPLIIRLAGSGFGMIGGALPTSYVIDRAGVLRYAEAGAFTDEGFEAVVGPLLAEAAPAPATTHA